MRRILALELFGPTVEFLTSPQNTQSNFCVLKGTLPPGVSVPLHSHADTEDFFVISVEIEGLRQEGDEGYRWIKANTGDYIHVPANSQHAWRNISNKPVLVHIIATKMLGRFFEETGRPKTNTPQPATSEDLARFEGISRRYGYWNASPEENAAVGIQMSF